MTTILPPDWEYDPEELAREKSGESDADEPSDFGTIIDRVIPWNDYSIGVQYLPGGVRFPGRKFAQALRSGYGHVRGCTGYNGRALKAYLAPEFFNDGQQPSDRVWELYQRSPDTGELDDVKLMIGYPDEQAATKAYLEEMPISHFGGLREIDPSEVNGYRRVASSFAEPLQVDGEELTDEEWRNLTQITDAVIDEALNAIQDPSAPR
jgi:hypothetical protein